MHFPAVLVATFASLAAAHPGHDHAAEVVERRQFIQNVARSDLGHCAEKLKARGVEARAVQRRKAIADAKAKRGIAAREVADKNKSHLSTADYDLNTPLDVIFATNNSCLLSPEVTEGPYYVSGEHIRKDLTEEEQGVALTVDIAVYDVDTCEPIPQSYIEIWSCNSTGIYSGVPSGANYTSAPQNLQTTFLRGLQLSDEDGAVQFDTLYPGHYEGRTQHIHVMVHPNATARENNTILDTTASHVGQIYFDQELSDQVETYEPYASNPQAITTNYDDMLIDSSLATGDAMVNYVLLGEEVGDGLLAWISFGVNTTYAKSVSDAATYYEGGGVANSDSTGGAPPM